MDLVRQGDILFLEKNSMHVLVLSRDLFNRSGLAVVCPVRKEAFEDALHIPVETPVFKGTALLGHKKASICSQDSTGKLLKSRLCRSRTSLMQCRVFLSTARFPYEIRPASAARRKIHFYISRAMS